jgi:undecaprenyl diphosphate synthase
MIIHFGQAFKLFDISRNLVIILPQFSFTKKELLVHKIPNLPKHVLIIPDGGRRWARKHGKFPSDGLQAGVERFREISKTAFEMGVHYFTFWAASVNNLTIRSSAEVQTLALLLRHEIEKKSTLENCLKNQARFRVIGSWYGILHDVRLLHAIRTLQEQTKSCDRHFLTILFGYSGIGELAEAVKWLHRHPPKRFDEYALKKAVWTYDLPPVDLVIRTGAERQNWTHNSGGILNPWLTPDSQIFSPQVLWPDFTAEMFRQAVKDYSEIQRRFGA